MNTVATTTNNPMRLLCRRMGDLYENPSPSMVEVCADAATRDRAAFWTTTGWEDMTVQLVAWLACYGGELHLALDRYAGTPPRKEILDALVPLNHKAILQLRMAYMAINEYPSIPSLHARTEKRS